MNQRKKIVEVARTQIGYKEGANNSNKYGKWYGANNVAWCAIFVSWCANQAGIPTSIVPKLAYVPYEYDFFAMRKEWHPRGRYIPQPGDLIIYGANDHIGIVEKVSNSYVWTIEGNTSSGGNVSNGEGVYRRQRALSNSWIKGYCSPAYIEEEEKPKEEEDEMKYYQTLDEIPDYARPTIEEMIQKGILKGDGKGLNLSEDNMKMFVYLKRAKNVGWLD